MNTLVCTLLMSFLLVACSTNENSKAHQTNNSAATSGDAVAATQSPPPQPPSYSVAAAHPLVTQAAMRVMAEGGNAFDAAITASTMLAVVEPFGSGIGGGGFWLMHNEATQKNIFVDGRETAPSAATSTLYQDDTGQVSRELATNNPLAAGIPGSVAAIDHIHKNYSTLPLSRLLAPAIKAARQGFKVTPGYISALKLRESTMKKWPSSSMFFDNGTIPKPGWVLQQVDLANTLEQIATNGRDGFYTGEVANKLVKSVQQDGGIWTLDDLKNYRVVEREPISFSFQGNNITTSPLPSSGGLVMGLIFKQLEATNYAKEDDLTQKHLLIEAMRNAYYQRALSMGDPDFTDDNGLQLLSPKAVQKYAKRILTQQATPSQLLKPVTAGTQGQQTTHFSIIDAEGNQVAVTLSINLYFGSGYVARDTGVLLNNEMDDFSAKPGEPNAYGLVGSEANKIEPGKRPLSSMTPTFIEDKDDLYILGTPGGSRIISMVAEGILEAVKDKSAQQIVTKPRLHHQYLPDEVGFEPQALDESEQKKLKQLGHKLKQSSRQYGNMQVIHWDKARQKVTAAADPRGEGEAEVSQ